MALTSGIKVLIKSNGHNFNKYSYDEISTIKSSRLVKIFSYMTIESGPAKLLHELLEAKEFLIIQDVDGVCIPLVKDPLKRRLDISYIESAALMKEEFAILTNGEHNGERGLNRIIENVFTSLNISTIKGRYLPGLAAGGIEYQNRSGKASYPGVTINELDFLREAPKEMKRLLKIKLSKLLAHFNNEQIDILTCSSVLATRFSPTINLNGIFSLIPNDIQLQIEIQSSIKIIMNQILKLAKDAGLENSFFLHIAPNLGRKDDQEQIKYAIKGDVGTTDIQLMLSGAIKESGLLVLINKYLKKRDGIAPFGEDFNVRNAPDSIPELKELCQSKVEKNKMPILIGVGDTVTSHQSKDGKSWLRGGSDRGFLTLIQELGEQYNKENKILLVDSSGGEVDRPSLSNKDLAGISDPEDPLKFNAYFKNGPISYIEWFNQLAKERSKMKL